MRRVILAALVFAAVSAATVFAFNPDELNKITFDNSTGSKIEMVFLSPADSQYWGPDIIGADYFLKKYSVQYNKPFCELSPETLTTFMQHEWPGNVRELENLIKRVVVLGSETHVRDELIHIIAAAAHQPAAPAPARRTPIAAAEASDATTRSLKDISRSAARVVERELILKMLQRTRWNRKETAGNLGISYKALLYKIKENGLD